MLPAMWAAMWCAVQPGHEVAASGPTWSRATVSASISATSNAMPRVYPAGRPGLPPMCDPGRRSHRGMTNAFPSPSGDWPELTSAAWPDTRDTLHLWTQVIGKVRMGLTPMLNHWWQVALYVSG